LRAGPVGDRSAGHGDLGAGLRGGVAGVEGLGTAQRDRAVVGGVVTGADLLHEALHRRGVPAVGADDRLELGRHALDLGPAVDALVAVLGTADPFAAG